jgi:hypothetical protein
MAKRRATFLASGTKLAATPGPANTMKSALKHLRAGDREEALKGLTRLCEEREVYSLMSVSDRFYDPIRNDQRFG